MKKQVIFGSVPSKSNAYKIIYQKGSPTLAKTPALTKYENDFFIQCNFYRNANIEGYFEMTIDVFYPNQRSDLDNALKIILDCLQRVKAIKNDNKCTRILINKYLDKASPRVEFILQPV
ncbi:RusA family crossover junction endodeoxyribonuclease [Tellurirhabdus bombi]|uniref:RusA family crossover junction endodeoxyribonuclease n=1 Tax=Tellurirhabdus bombi TaxID=2907205 RepID=UPI001F2192F7|nr:RusA family crossover junction endodeoxyribonuclease [Tellurirhabdus bombi]